ncbi:MAG: hypothetical protein AVDCRST_MAG73-3654 [uncultured Thermomicrobiales bacterium]|uniref:Uncharacterized protein n=1 Tax=uncultured Thermomicrobiales bacterium TaxID=1645740 RepID=A0A6J4UYL3_9BACT|nr:MAG: hypothetical protein AVDCRST_MAG73-3654 [uncultured Thermomicrobiales bacterium]
MPWQQLGDPGNPENGNASNGGDLCKHTVYLALLDYLLARPPWAEQLRVRECHAGRGMYRIPAGSRRLLERLYAPLGAGAGVLLRDAQRATQTALSVWPDDPARSAWYSGSAVLNGWRLGRADAGRHLLELYEQAADTRAVLRAVFADPGLRPPRMDVRILPEPEPGRSFDGEAYVESNVLAWNPQDLILLDPFAMWRQPKDQARRNRYRRIVERVIARGRLPLAGPLLDVGPCVSGGRRRPGRDGAAGAGWVPGASRAVAPREPAVRPGDLAMGAAVRHVGRRPGFRPGRSSGGASAALRRDRHPSAAARDPIGKPAGYRGCRLTNAEPAVAKTGVPATPPDMRTTSLVAGSEREAPGPRLGG